MFTTHHQIVCKMTSMAPKWNPLIIQDLSHISIICIQTYLWGQAFPQIQQHQNACHNHIPYDFKGEIASTYSPKWFPRSLKKGRFHRCMGSLGNLTQMDSFSTFAREASKIGDHLQSTIGTPSISHIPESIKSASSFEDIRKMNQSFISFDTSGKDDNLDPQFVISHFFRNSWLRFQPLAWPTRAQSRYVDMSFISTLSPRARDETLFFSLAWVFSWQKIPPPSALQLKKGALLFPMLASHETPLKILKQNSLGLGIDLLYQNPHTNSSLTALEKPYQVLKNPLGGCPLPPKGLVQYKNRQGWSALL